MSISNEIYQTLSKLREKYTDDDDIARINADFARVKKILAEQGFANNEATQELISMCRADILTAKTKLASDRTLVGDEKASRELWFLIESREWFLKLVVKDFDSEFTSLSNELKRELSK